MSDQGQIISQIVADSLAQELGIQPGDRLLSIDGDQVLDVFDYQVRQLKEQLVLTVMQQNGEILEIDLEKDEYEDLGLVFENPLLSECTNCHNRCIFCFIDQLPHGMRKTLYFKDDDMRMSFLHGNYVTLTNISDSEMDRLISYRFSPMNISVHATDPEIRRKMMRNRHAGDLFARLQKLAAVGIKLNCQLVLCPGINDGEVLERTLSDLASLGNEILSIAMVPVGITKYRDENKLFNLRPFSRDEALKVVKTVEKWQKIMLINNNSRIVFAGDEFYLQAGLPFPPAETYDDYPQLENGVGMAALFIDITEKYLSDPSAGFVKTSYKKAMPVSSENTEVSNVADWTMPAANREKPVVLIATGTAATAILAPFIPLLGNLFEIEVELQTVTNDFFGEKVTVAGLITGRDLLGQLQKRVFELNSVNRTAIVLIPECMLKQDDDVFLDDLSLQELSDRLVCQVVVVPEQAEGLLTGLAMLNQMNR